MLAEFDPSPPNNENSRQKRLEIDIATVAERGILPTVVKSALKSCKLSICGGRIGPPKKLRKSGISEPILTAKIWDEFVRCPVLVGGRPMGSSDLGAVGLGRRRSWRKEGVGKVFGMCQVLVLCYVLGDSYVLRVEYLLCMLPGIS